MRHLSMTAEFTDDCMREAPEALGQRTIRVGRGAPEPVILHDVDHRPRWRFADGKPADAFVMAAVAGGPARVWRAVVAYLEDDHRGPRRPLTPEARACAARAGLELPANPWAFSGTLRRWLGRVAGLAGWNRWTLVLLDETEYWCDEVRTAFARVFGLYAYDALSVTHMCEVTPSFMLHPLGPVGHGMKPELDDDDEGREHIYELLRQGEDFEVRPVHCHDLERLSAARQHVIGFLPPEVDNDVREALGDAGDNEHVFKWAEIDAAQS